MDFWCIVLARACDSQAELQRGQESELKALIYPLTQVALGAIKYVFDHFMFTCYHLIISQANLKLAILSFPPKPYPLPRSPCSSLGNFHSSNALSLANHFLHSLAFFAAQVSYSPAIRPGNQYSCTSAISAHSYLLRYRSGRSGVSSCRMARNSPNTGQRRVP